MTVAYVDTRISEIFFNQQHSQDIDGNFDNLQDEAVQLLENLEELGVDVPDSRALINDFTERVI